MNYAELHQLHILVVEDEALIALHLQELLIDAGRAVLIAASCEQAHSLAAIRWPDLVLMDIQLQGLPDGIDCILNLRKVASVPVIYLSGTLSTRGTRSRAEMTEPVAILEKPIAAAQVLAAVRTVAAR